MKTLTEIEKKNMMECLKVDLRVRHISADKVYDIMMSKRNYIYIDETLIIDDIANDKATHKCLENMLPKNYPGINTFVFYDDYNHMTVVWMNTKKNIVMFVTSLQYISIGNGLTPADAIIYLGDMSK